MSSNLRRVAAWGSLGLLALIACKTSSAASTGPLTIIEGVRDAGSTVEVRWPDGGVMVVPASELQAPRCEATSNPPIPLPAAASDGGPPYGLMQIKCLVLPSGRMDGCQLAAGVGGEADTLAVAAVGSWRCTPATLKGQPVAAAHLTTIDFGAPPAPVRRTVKVGPAAPLPVLPKGLPKLKAPDANPLTAEKAELGAVLFSDARLVPGERACASCHAPSTGYTTAKAVELELAGAKRALNVPSLVNVAWQYGFGLEGRFATLEEQLDEHTRVLGLDWARASAELTEDPADRALFERAFGAPEASQPRAVQALASFLRTVRSSPGAYEKFLGGEKSALSRDAEQGRLAFDKLGCSGCHRAPRFLDAEPHPLPDGSLAVRTPGLRNVAQTGPWLHDGSARTLSDAISAHALKPAGKGDSKAKGTRLPAAQVAQLKAFLEALDGPTEAMAAPALSAPQ